MKLPLSALERPVTKVPPDAPDREFHQALISSGLVDMMEQIYPQVNSQHN